MKVKPQRGTLYEIHWRDIQSDSGWKETAEEDIRHAECTSFGIFLKEHEGNYVFYASFHDMSIGDRVAIPKVVITDIKPILKNVHETGGNSRTERRR